MGKVVAEASGVLGCALLGGEPSVPFSPEGQEAGHRGERSQKP